MQNKILQWDTLSSMALWNCWVTRYVQLIHNGAVFTTNILVIERLSRYVCGLIAITLDFGLINQLACKLSIRLEVLYILWSDINNSLLNYIWYMQSWKIKTHYVAYLDYFPWPVTNIGCIHSYVLVYCWSPVKPL